MARTVIVTVRFLAILSSTAVSITLKQQGPLTLFVDSANQAVQAGLNRLGHLSSLGDASFQSRISQITPAMARESSKRAWTDRTLTASQRADHLLAAMTTKEKLNMIHGSCMMCPWVGMVPGNTRLGIPPLNLQDGPQGVRNQPFADYSSTSWPGAMAMTSTWDPEAIYEWGKAMGEEFYAKGINVQLGPGLNLARLPTNGRNFEYLSGEDPYLGYQLVKEAVKGIQGQNVIACAKHWIVNSQEVHRQDGSENVDERTLHEMYYPPFEAAVEAGIGAFMCSYNQVNGTHACENSAVNNIDLKTTLGFKGFMMSDWFATHAKDSLKRGLDMEQPGSGAMNEDMLRQGIAVGNDVDGAVHRILHSMFAVGIMDEPVGNFHSSRFHLNVSTPDHIALARKLSAEATVLLKNDQNVLPLPQDKKIAVLGFADDTARALSFGHGSGEVRPSTFVTPEAGIREAAGKDAQVSFHSGANLEAAKAAAAAADYAVVFVGASASEGQDRDSLSLDGKCKWSMFLMVESECGDPNAYQNRLVNEIASVNKNTIVVLSVPGAILMPWSNKVASALVNFMPGQEAGHAIADVLFGKENPAAKLPITMPNRENEVDFTEEQYPGIRSSDGIYQMNYLERLRVGYRYYDFKNTSFTTGFPFGHGLSYTSFEYSSLHFTPRPQLGCSFIVTNTGKRAGAEVAQLYLQFPEEAGEPRQLKGFQKTAVLQPGESERVTLGFTPRDLSIWDVEAHDWSPIAGEYEAFVGSSSRDFRLQGKFFVSKYDSL